MKRFGSLILCIGLLAPVFAQAAERVSCADEANRYQVKFDLEDKVATDLTFNEGSREIARYSSAEAERSRVWFTQIRNYDFSLGGMQYFDFSRKGDAEEFTGAFLFGGNPFIPEVHVTCRATAITPSN